MRNLYLTILGLCMIGLVSGGTPEVSEKPDENPSYWKTNQGIGLNLSQVGLKNWSAGGDPSISFIISAYLQAKMIKHKHLWEADLSGEWGMLRIKGEDFRKNADFVAVSTKYGFQIDKLVQDEEGKDLPGKWYMTILTGVKSQFSKTYAHNDDGDRINTQSRYSSPITINYSLGFDYAPNPHFSLFISPVAAKQIIVKSDRIAELNLHGNNSKNINNFFGATVVATYKQQVYPKPANRIAKEDGVDPNAVFLNSKLALFRDYLNGPAENIDVDWQTSVTVKVARFISASVFTHLIWDYDVDTDASEDGMQRNLQFKNVIGVGVAYTIGDKEPNLNK